MNLQEPFVITVSREIGSGGRTVGRMLATELNVRFCDKDLIEALQDKFNLTPEGIEKLKGQKKNWLSDFVDFIKPVPTPSVFELNKDYEWEYRGDLSAGDLYKAETEILKGVAAEGSCVIAGRSGFHVFREHPNCLHVFIKASEEYRVARVMKKQGMKEDEALALIRKIDKARENYIERCTGVSRYDSRNYNLVIDAGGHSEEEIVRFILSYIKTEA